MPFNRVRFSPHSPTPSAPFPETSRPTVSSLRRKPSVLPILVFCLALIGSSPQASHAQTAVAPTVGDGLTTATAFQITELGNLVWLGDRAANETTGKYYQLMNDLDASDTANWNDAGTTTDTLEGFRPIGFSLGFQGFKGVFSGDGHKITGLTINRPNTNQVGLFCGIAEGGLIQNLSLEGGSITGRDSVGGLAGVGGGHGSISNCSVSCTVTGNQYVGGLMGQNNFFVVSVCSSSSSVTGMRGVGGLIGFNESTDVTSCTASGSITVLFSSNTAGSAGGLIGSHFGGRITSCSASGPVTNNGTGGNAGGLIGGISSGGSRIVSCSATGPVTNLGNGNTGGLIGGNSSGEIISCTATGPVTATGLRLYVGGLIGSNTGKLTSNSATGTVSATGTSDGASLYVGGLVGYHESTVNNCSATGRVTATITSSRGSYLYAGGLMGQTRGWITNSFANGAVICKSPYSMETQSAGGLVGNSSGSLQRCYAMGTVTQSETDSSRLSTGGLAGLNSNLVENCYATGAVISSGAAGGLVGRNSGLVSRCFSVGAVSGETGMGGGLVGYTPSTTTTACYWDVESSGQTASEGGAGAVGRTTAEMQRQATFQPGGGAGASDWDFTSVWGIAEGQSYPYLRAFESAPPQFRLNVSVQGNGSVTLDPPGGVYAPGTTVTLTATPVAGTHFADWTGTVDRTAASTTILMNTHKNVSARFLPGYEIRTLAELQAIATGDLGGHYTLMNDIDASDTVNWHDAGTTEGLLQGFRPIGTYFFSGPTTATFQGVFEGNGKKITGLTINRPNSTYIGLFGYIGADGEVRNLTLEGGTIKGYSSVGGLAGGNAGLIENCIVSTAVTGSSQSVGGLVGNSGGAVARILNCISSGPVTGSSWNQHLGGLGGYNSGLVSGCVATGEVTTERGNYIGGLIGKNYDGRVIRCSSIGSVTTQWANQVGGLVGHNYHGSVSDSYAQGVVTGSESVGGLVGLNENASLTNCFATGGVTGSQSAYTGGLVGKDTTNKVTACYWDVETTGQAKSAGGTGAVGKTTAEMKRQATFQPGGGTGATDWNFSTVWGIIEGQSYPYLRSASSATPFYLGTTVNEGQGTITLNPAGGFYAPGTPVTLTATAAPGYHFAGWTGPVTERTTDSTTVFMDAHKAVSARFLRNYEIRTLDELQAIATGDLTGYYTLMNDLDASATATWHDAGTTEVFLQGFRPIGTYPKAYIPDTVSFRGVFEGNGKTIGGLTINRPDTNYIGLFGVVGEKGEIRNLNLKDVRVTGRDSTGAVAGVLKAGTIRNGRVTGVVRGGEYVGGLVGDCSDKTASIANCSTAVTVTGNGNAGGVLGLLTYGKLSDCSATGSVTCLYSGAGGLVGSNNIGWIHSCFATGPVQGDTNVGGLIGDNAPWFSSPERGKVSNCFASGPVTGRLDAGGLVGYNNAALIESCFATGGVKATDGINSWAGGLIGYNYTGSATNCFATGPVTGFSQVGGLAGYSYGGRITHCFAVGPVTDPNDPNHTSGLMGNCQSTTITACYWDKETTGQTASIGSDARFGTTTAEMKTQVTFLPGGGTGADDWDFTSVWGLVEGQSYPYLRFMPPPFHLNVAVEGEGAFTLAPAGTAVPPPGTGVTYAPGATVTLAAGEPGTGHHFAEWVGAVTDPKTSVTTVLMDTHRSVTAVFAPDECKLLLGPTVHGSILKSPDQTTYPYDSTVTLTPQPDPGYCFAGWTGDLPSTDKPWQVPLKVKILRDTALSARFEPIRHTGVWMVR